VDFVDLPLLVSQAMIALVSCSHAGVQLHDLCLLVRIRFCHL